MSVSNFRGEPHPFHVPEDAVDWGDYSAWYPEGSMPGMRAKRIVGPGGAIESTDTLFGILELDVGAEYPKHRHAAPEVYFVLAGRAECTFGAEVFEVGPGSTIRTPANEWHAFRNLGDEVFRAVAYWYAPAGDVAPLAAPLELDAG